MATILNPLNPNNQLFVELANGNYPQWWSDVMNDKDVYIEIRKGYRLDVYHNGGAIFRDVKFVKGEFTWKTHAKYLIKGEYVGPNGIISQITLDEPNWLNAIKKNIRTYYPTASEKGFQAKLRTKQHYCLDTELAFNDDKDKNRFDVVWLDTKKKKIVVAELKLPDNGELFDESIHNQLEKYVKVINKQKTCFEAYFKSLFQCKKKIGILSEQLQKIDNIDDYTMEEKPLLVVGGCTQPWIDEHCNDINERVRDVAYGVYYYGKGSYSDYHCNLESGKNRYIFK